MATKMTETQSALWKRLDEFSIDSGDEVLTFARRLARENGWSVKFAQRVVLEYKRFVFLCCEAGHACTPSDHVDQAWHLHLTYTKSYWEEMCQKILPRPLHHNPTKGGSNEDSKFDDWYAKTTEAYERFFDEPVPADIWPPSEQRFGEDPYAQRVNLKRHWVIPKQPVRRVGSYAGLAALIAVLAGCSSAMGGDPTPLIVLGVGLFVIILVVVAASSSKGKRSSGCSTSSGCGGSGTSFSSDSGSHGHGHGGHGDGHGGHGDGGGHGGDGGGDGGGSGCGGGGCGGGGCGGGD
jgi:hypothetical protein